MNQFVHGRFSERQHRLALGLEPIDALRATRVGVALDVVTDGVPPLAPRWLVHRSSGKVQHSDLLPRIPRHDSCLHALRFHPGLKDPVDIRLFDRKRRFVPRRLRYPILSEAVADASPAAFRIRRPQLFPGAAYDLSMQATGLRGRVLRGGQPLRWARIEARHVESGTVVGRAHGDDRGEFLLLLASTSSPVGELVDPLPVAVHWFGPALEPVPASPSLPAEDWLWDLPLEVAPAPGLPDDVSSGVSLPQGYVASAQAPRVVDFELGRIRSSDELPFVFT